MFLAQRSQPSCACTITFRKGYTFTDIPHDATGQCTLGPPPEKAGPSQDYLAGDLR